MKSSIDIIHKIATIVIAGCSLYFTRYIFKYNSQSQAADKEKDRNFQSLKVLVLDHSLKHLYSFFENTIPLLNEFKADNISDEQKSIINDKIADEFISLRMKFVDLLLAVDNSLYNTVLSKLDNFQQHISETVFDNGVKLSHEPKFDELILVFHTNLKTEIISTLFKYKG
ncbi:hypothetical protein [Pedobacter xixiisoli]|uniref:hypothetical protein n=1 Tax=Pedobacter xixiisoli TaxID=1476464 RepID=UPI00110CCFF2|nr:hypothetical protein [Pedobacter xixiisoli]